MQNDLVPDAFAGLVRPARYKVMYGGRGGGKSWSIARVLVLLATMSKLRILCAREFQNSIADSVHRLLSDQIYSLGLIGKFEITKTSIRAENGSEFLFKGLRHNAAEIKSTEGIDVCWVEEAQRVSADSWELLLPTIRKESSEIWISFNPYGAEDPTYKRFVQSPPPNSWVRRINYDENPHFPDVLRQEMEHSRATDPDGYAHIWLGEPNAVSDAQVLRGRYRIEPFEPQAGWGGPYFGADWGFSVDPTALVRCWVNGRTLYIEHEAWGVGVDIDQTPALFDSVPGAREHVIRADCARPETISHMQRHGYPRVTACDKWAGSVEDGTEHLRSYEQIIIHPRCKHVADEARLWSYKTDRLTGDVLPVLLDKNDHTMDALRYALNPLIKRRTATKVVRVPHMSR